MSETALHSSQPALCLFDVDGTMLRTGGATSRCMRRAGEAVLGPGFEWAPVIEGLLDPELLAQQIEHNGLEPTDQRVAAMAARYLDKLEAELARPDIAAHALGGVKALLTALRHRAEPGHPRGVAGDAGGGVSVGLLTGNYQRAVALKLEAVGLSLDAFDPVCCAEHAADRASLLAEALRQTEQRLSVAIPRRRVFVIGDTPRDVACAHSSGCIAAAVTTGRYDAQQLADAGADLILPDLTHSDALLHRL